MLIALTGDINTGRLMRLQYLGYSLLVVLFVFGFVLLTILAIGAGEHILGGDFQECQAQLRQGSGLLCHLC